jgi:hypothetical protein
MIMTMIGWPSDIHEDTTLAAQQGVGDRWRDIADVWRAVLRRPPCSVERAGNEPRFFDEIDDSNADDPSRRVTAEFKAGGVSLDLSQVRFYCVARVRMMLAARSAAGGLDGGLRVCSAAVTRILQVCGRWLVDSLPLSSAPEIGEGFAGVGS